MTGAERPETASPSGASREELFLSQLPRTLDEHNRNVTRWRRLMREKGQQVPDD